MVSFLISFVKSYEQGIENAHPLLSIWNNPYPSGNAHVCISHIHAKWSPDWLQLRRTWFSDLILFSKLCHQILQWLYNRAYVSCWVKNGSHGCILPLQFVAKLSFFSLGVAPGITYLETLGGFSSFVFHHETTDFCTNPVQIFRIKNGNLCWKKSVLEGFFVCLVFFRKCYLFFQHRVM